MDVPEFALTLTKTKGATRQLEVAIDALQRGDFDIAVTLAGAAEGMIEHVPHRHLFHALRDNVRWHEFDEKTRVAVLNQERDWLKHPTPDRPQEMTIEWHDAAFMIARGASKIEAWTPKMVEFKTWYLHRLNQLDE